MRDEYHDEKAEEILWEHMVAKVPLLLSSGYGLTFVVIPSLGLIYALFSKGGIDIGTALVRFLVYYIPYALISSTLSQIVRKNFIRDQGKKYDLSILVSSLSSGLSLFVMSGLSLTLSMIFLQQGLGLSENKQKLAIIWYLIFDLLVISILLTFRKKILVPQTSLREEIKQDSSLLVYRPFKFVAIGVLLIFILLLLFLLTGFVDFDSFILSLTFSLISPPILFFSIIFIYRFFRMLVWRKQNFWGNYKDL